MPPEQLSRDLAEVLRLELERLYGPLIGGSRLIAALGLSNAAALRQARRRGRVTVPLFTLPQRRGYFALTRDIAEWLAASRQAAFASVVSPKEEGANRQPN